MYASPGVDWDQMAQDMVQKWAFVNKVTSLEIP
jgi:hypothetical protein